ncbi:transposase-like protein [Streptomyces sp. V4I8]
MPASIFEEVGGLFEAALTRETITRLSCPSCGSAHVAQLLGDNGGISYVCTACGHSWS